MTELEVIKKLEEELDIYFLEVSQKKDLVRNYGKNARFIMEKGEVTGLSISNISLEFIPKDISYFKKLKTLNIYGCALTYLTNEVYDILSLEELFIEENNINCISSKISKLKNLVSLDIEGNVFEKFPSELKYLANLRQLRISNINFTNLFFIFKNLPNLKELSVRELKECKTNEKVEPVLNIKKLTIYDSKLNYFPKELSMLKNLEVFEILENDISGLPSEIGSFLKLKELLIADNKLREISNELLKLKEIEKLYIYEDNLSKIPDNIAVFSNLKELTLSSKRDFNLTNDIYKLLNLEKLTLFLRKVYLNSNISNLRNLKELTLMDVVVGQSLNSILKIKSLEILDLIECNVYLYNINDAELDNLKVLRLRGVKAEKIPEIVFKMQNLVILDLSNNFICEIPAQVNILKNLESLYLTNNCIATITNQTFELKKLRNLKLDYNIIDVLPKWIFELNMKVFVKETSEKGIHIEGNNLLYPPIERIQQGKEAVQDYFKEMEKGKERLYESKVLVVGEPEAGKTTFTNQITEKCCFNDIPKISTIGVEIFNNYLFEGQENSPSVLTHFWDFGGQKTQYMMHQFFMNEDSLYVLVVGNRSERDHLEYWLNILNLLGKNSKVVIVINYRENQTISRKQIEEKVEKYVGNLDIEIYEVNLKENCSTEFKFLKQKIYENLLALKHMGKYVPVSFREIINKLNQIDKNMITYDRFEEICSESGVFSTSSQKYMLKDLALTGYIVYYDDANLCDTLFLNPNWVIKSAYAVLKNQNFLDVNGRVSGRDIKKVWENKYSPMEIAKLFDLLLKDRFDICFKLQNTEDEYIIPIFLSEDYPDYNWNDDESTYFIYKYPFMPVGIISRLIVRLHEYIEIIDDNYLMWRNGIVIKYKNARARIVKDYHQRWGNEIIYIEVTGNEFDKRDLLIKIRDEIDKLNSNFYNISEMMIPCSCETCRKNDNIFNRYFFNYKRLEKFLKSGARTDKCDCANEVDIYQLLGEVYLEKRDEGEMKILEMMKEHGGKGSYVVNNPTLHNNPTISPKIVVENNPTITVSAGSSNEVKQSTDIDITTTITNEIQLINNLDNFKDSFLDLKDELETEAPELNEQMNKLEKDINKITPEADKDLCKSRLRRLGNFLKEFENEDSDIHKKIKGAGKLLGNVKEVAKYYDEYVSWIPGLPNVPKFLLKD